MAKGIYDIIQKMSWMGTVLGKRVYVSKNQHWLLGSYDNLKHIAPQLRDQPQLLNQLQFPGGKLKFGLRQSDAFSTMNRIRSFRSKIKGKTPDVSPDHLVKIHQKSRAAGHNQRPRLTDLYRPAHDFFSRATLESHHIVEKGLLKDLGLDKDELDPGKAPCVLIVAELHRRLFTPEGSKHRKEVKTSSTTSQTFDKLRESNNEMYNSPQMSEILEVGKIIIDKVGK